jgi:fluoride ion exporter CrcB/FEX
MLIKIIMVITGGALGALTRYSIGSQIDKNININFPIGIFFVNLLLLWITITF